LQCPIGTLPPAMGTTCGRREREADAGERRGAILSRARVATVEGTLVHRMPVAFAGSRRSVGLGRSARRYGARPVHSVAPATTGVLWKNEEGNVVSVRQAHALILVTRCAAKKRGHVLRSVQRPVHVNRRWNSRHASGEGRCGRFGIAVGQTWVTRRNRHRGRNERTNARLAASHRCSG